MERTKALSKVQVLDYPILAPGKCVQCGSSKHDRKYVDLGIDFETGPGFNWVIYLCTFCLAELFDIAMDDKTLERLIRERLNPPVAESRSDFIESVVAQGDTVDSDSSDRLAAVEQQLAALSEQLSGKEGKPSDEPTIKPAEPVHAADKPSTKQDTGRRPSGVQSFTELVSKPAPTSRK